MPPPPSTGIGGSAWSVVGGGNGADKLEELVVEGKRSPKPTVPNPSISAIPLLPVGVPLLPPIQSQADAAVQAAKNFLCADSEEDATAALFDLVANTGTGAEFANPVLAIYAAVAGVGTSFPQATEFLGKTAASGLEGLG